MANESETIDYVVDIPQTQRFGNRRVLAVTKASSPRDAVSAVIANSFRRNPVGLVMHVLDGDLGGAETYAYGVDRDFVDGETGRSVSRRDERVGREMYMAETIRKNENDRAKNLGRRPSDLGSSGYLPRAKRYIDFYEKEQRKAAERVRAGQ